MSKSSFFIKVSGQSIFRRATSRSLVMVMFRYILIAVIFLHSFYVVSYLEGNIVPSSSSSSSSSFEGYPLQARHKQNWGRGFILLLPQTAVLLGSDAGSDVIKPASSFVIQNRQTACSMWCPMYGAHC